MSTHGEGSGKVRGTQTDEDKNDNMDSESKKRHNKINSVKYVKNSTTRSERRRKYREYKNKNKTLETEGDKDTTSDIERNKDKQYDNEEQTWGDEIELDDNWPQSNKKGTIRIIHYNANGITSGNQYGEWETLIHRLDDIQADIFTINETSIDTRQSNVQFKIREEAWKFDQSMKIKMESSKSAAKTEGSIFKPGGTMVGIRGNWAGRTTKIGEEITKDELGRWSAIHLQGKGGQIVTVMSVYRVCTYGEGKSTAYIQQQVDYMNKYKKIIDPREQIIKDVKRVLLKLIQNKHKVIIGADINDDAEVEYKNKWNDMIEEIGMRNAHQATHPKKTLPRTYDRGRRCIDMIAISENITNSMIARSGILPFYTIGASDHRAMYIDVLTNELFDSPQPDVTKQTYKRFTTKNVKKCDKYLQKLDQYLEQSRLYKKTKEIKKETEELLEQEKKINENSTKQDIEDLRSTREDIENRLQKLDQKRWELMIAAERTCGPSPMHGKKWYSRELVSAAKEFVNAKSKLRKIQCTTQDKNELVEAIKARETALMRLRTVQKEDRQYRDMMLDELAEKRAKKWNVTKKQAMRVLAEAEKNSGMYKKIGITINGHNKEGITSLMIPTKENPGGKIYGEEDNKNGMWEQTRDSEEIYEHILLQNAKMLVRSRKGITASGSLSDALGRDAENKNTVEEILKGNINPKKYTENLQECKEEAEEFIRQMKEEDNIKEMKWKFGKAEYEELFKKTRESTACGPSGLHMSHWVAALQHEHIMEFHATLTWAAFAMGITYKRWTISWHCMIKKLDQPYINKLRIIQLFEGDFNGGLKYLLGKVFMQKMVREGRIDPNAYGSIPGKDATEAMMALQYVYDNHRILKRDLLVVFNDAAGCYDRVRPNHSELCSLRMGCARSIMKTHTKTQNDMKHLVKTASGVSKGYIKWDNIDEDMEVAKSIIDGISVYTGNIGGIGQGGGASPVEWLTVLLAMMKTYRRFAEGAEIIDPAGIYNFVMAILSYVDDNSLLKSIKKDKSVQQVFGEISKEMEHWRNILRVTGGDLAPQKCTVTLMKWAWNPCTGNPYMQTEKEAPGTIVLKGDLNSEEIRLKRLEINEGMKQLGIILPINGTFNQEKIRRIQECEELGKKLYRSPLTHTESIVVYKMYFIPKIIYPLSITQFKQKECNEIQSKFYKYALPKMGINRHTPRAILFGPIDMGGAGLFDIYVAQAQQHIVQAMYHIRRMDHVGQALLSNLSAYEVTIGSSNELFQLNPWKYCYGEKESTIFFLWKMIRFWKLNVKVVPNNRNKNNTNKREKTIMDIAVNDVKIKCDEWKLRAINACRLYHGVVYPSDMSLYSGKFIQQGYLYGNGSYRKKQHQGWPNQPVPLDHQWTEWRRFVRENYLLEDMKTWRVQTIPGKRIKTFNRITLTQRIERLLQFQEDGPIINYDEILRTLPSEYQSYLQVFTITDDTTCNDLLHALENNTLHIASDGSHMPGTTDGAGAAIAMDEENDTHAMWAGCKCEIEDKMTSQTAEHYGAISGLLLILILITGEKKKYKEKPTVQFWIDNAEVLIRLKRAKEPKITLKQYSIQDYTHSEMMTKLASLLQQCITIKFLKVKSHQEPNATQSIEVKMNEQADRIANEIRTTFIGPIHRRLPSPYDGIYIETINKTKTNDIHHWIRERIKGDEINTYLMKRNHWKKNILETIALQSLGTCIKSYKQDKQLALLQLIHNWQNTGRQKQKFLQSRIDQQQRQMQEAELKLLKKEIIQIAQCPMRCGKVENHLHYLECEHTETRQKRTVLINKMKANLTAKNVYGPIISYMVNGLLWKEEQKKYQYKIRMTRADYVIDKALAEQYDIGWKNIRRGLISKNWIIAQQLHIDDSKATEKYDWGKTIIEQVLIVSWEMWIWRNKVLHGPSKTDTENEKRELLLQKVDHYFDRLKNITNTTTTDTIEIFGTNRGIMKNKIKKRDNDWIEAWIKIAEEMVVKMEKRDTNTIDKWIIRESTKKK